MQPDVGATLHAEIAAALATYAPSDLDIARHEAGHAVVAAHYGGRITSCRIRLDERRQGGLCKGETDAWMDGDNIFALAVYAWAGAIAEGSILGAGNDFQSIAALHLGWGKSRTERSPYGVAWRLVRGELRLPIRRVAAELLAHGSLDHAGVLAAMAGPR